MALIGQQRNPLYRSAALWHTAIVLAVAVVILALADSSTDGSSSPIGIGWTVALLASIAAVGVAIHLLTARSLERRLVQPLQRIEEITQAIVSGAASNTIALPKGATQDVIRVAEAINSLSQKATKDIAEMRRLERVRSEFVGNVSHELRTPIFSVQGYLETLLDGALEDPAVSRQFLEKAFQNALRLNALLSDLIEISRIESGELRFSFRSFNATSLLHDIVTSMEIRCAPRNISLHLTVPPADDLMVYADKERLTQVLTNLVDNAIKYNREGGSVTVRGEHEGKAVRISIEDTGIGIPGDSKDRIFERFYRVDKDRSRAVGGTGLGLAIVKHILEAHQAPITVTSEPNVGTTISFVLKSG